VFGFLNDKSPISERRSFNGDVSSSRQFFFLQKKKEPFGAYPESQRSFHFRQCTFFAFS
jgi:hypothetical protein